MTAPNIEKLGPPYAKETPVQLASRLRSRDAHLQKRIEAGTARKRYADDKTRPSTPR